MYGKEEEEEETSLRMCLERAALGDVKIKVLYVFFILHSVLVN